MSEVSFMYSFPRSRVLWAAVLAQLAVLAVAASTFATRPPANPGEGARTARAEALMVDDALTRRLGPAEEVVGALAESIAIAGLPRSAASESALEASLLRALAGPSGLTLVSVVGRDGVPVAEGAATQAKGPDGPGRRLGSLGSRSVVDQAWFKFGLVAADPIRAVLDADRLALVAPIRGGGEVLGLVVGQVPVRRVGELVPVSSQIDHVGLVSGGNALGGETSFAAVWEGIGGEDLELLPELVRGEGVVELNGDDVRFERVQRAPGWRMVAVFDGHAGVAPGGDAVMWALVAGGLVVLLSAVTAAGSQRWMVHAEHMASTDELTGLPNRRSLMRDLERSLAAARRSGRPLAVAMLDCDRFKSINDGLGHKVGDEVLVAMAGRLRRALDEDDLVGRLGGDEFVVVLPETNLDSAVIALGRVREHVASTPVAVDDGSVPISISVGVAEVQPGQDATAVLESADLALLEAKRAGRDRVMVSPG